METARFGFPFKGYNAAQDRHLVARDEISEDSHDLYFDPFEGKFYRRPGISQFSAAATVLESSNGQTRGLQGLELYSPNLTYPTIAFLWGEEISPTGTVGFYSHNGSGTHQQIAKSFGTTHYPSNLKFVPLDIPGAGWSRGATATQRNQICPGSRRVLQVADSLLMPSYLGTPAIWNKDFNDSSSSGSRNERIMPAGMIPPLWPIEISALGPVDANGTWVAGNKYYLSQIFQDQAGNFSQPYIPRPQSGDGYFIVPGPVGTRYQYIDWKIRIGPHGTKARWGVRSPAAGPSGEPDLNDLRLCFQVPNNTEVTYRDYGGNDLGLVADPIAVRFDHAWLRPARYVWSGNERIWAAYIKPQSAAIILAPDQNLSDDSAGLSTTFYSVNITLATQIQLRKDANTTVVTLSSSKSVQRVIDEINATTDTGANGGKWRAALVPGSDPTISSDQLFQTTSFNFGDDATTHGGTTTGDARAYCNAYPFVAHFITGYLANTPDLKRTVIYTFGGPGAAPNAPKAWGSTEKNKKTIPEHLGIIMGGASVPGMEIVPCSRGIAVIKNVKDIRTGLDEDFYVDILNHSRGCIAFDSIVQGDGWVGYMTAQGYVVTDGLREVIITEKIWNPAEPRGPFVYEISQSEVAIASDANTGTANVLSQFHARIMGNKLYLTYQSTAGGFRVPDRWLVYDFSAGAEASGLAEVLRPDGTPWGWSAPNRVTLATPVGTMAEVRFGSNGVAQFSAQETGSGSINAKVIEMDVGHVNEDGSLITEEGYCAMDFLGTTKRKQAHRVTALYKHALATQTLRFSRDKMRLSQVTRTLTQAATNEPFRRTVKELPLSARAAAQVVEIGWAGSGTDGENPEVFGFELEYEVSESLI